MFPPPEPAPGKTASSTAGVAIRRGASRRAATTPGSAGAGSRRAACRGSARLSLRRRRRDIVVETDAVRAMFTTRGGASEELAAEALSRCRTESRWISCRAHRRRSAAAVLAGTIRPLPRRCAMRFFKPSADSVTRQRRRRVPTSTTATHPACTRARSSRSIRQALLVGLRATVERNGAPVDADRAFGPGARHRRRHFGGMMYCPRAAHLLRRRRLRASTPTIAEQPALRGSSVRGRRRPLLPRRGSRPAQPFSVEYKPSADPVGGSNRTRTFVSWNVRVRRRRRRGAFFFGPKDFDMLTADRAATWCARSTSACFAAWSCRCCAR